jgi:hypothetical protein
MNRLANESSLYLRQHADNPVDWWPWTPAALAEAKRQNKPIFLSIGYSACHWCHVMAHESFEDGGTAAVMNEHFVNIKVDREERPDLDQIAMTAHGILNRGEGGGWPLSVWLTPDLTPFYAGTYFPPTDKYGRPSFRRVLHSIAKTWQEKADQLAEIGTAVAGHLTQLGVTAGDDRPLSLEPVTAARAALHRAYDPEFGGFGRQPKFPHALDLLLLLRSGDPADRTIVTDTLTAMARGGIYDQVGGGFHRYSVDRKWLVPHFEKMLYDNAQLPPVYVEAFRQTGNVLFRQIACETFDYVLTEMTSPLGGFYSTQDADSEGEEGKFFVWGEAELDAVLGNDATLAKNIWGTSAAGNFEGHNILHRWRSDADDAVGNGLPLDDFREALARITRTLYDHRAKRIAPGRDEKILTSWNGLMIHAFADAGMRLGEPRYVEAAENAATFVLANLKTDDGRLFRTCGIGTPAKYAGYLDDYAFFARSLVTLFDATGEFGWLHEAEAIVAVMLRHFADPAGGFFYTADDAETFITRAKEMHDGSIPSGNGTAALVLLQLDRRLGRPAYREIAERTIRAHRTTMDEQPLAATMMLLALDEALATPEDWVLVGPAAETAPLVRAWQRSSGPHRLVIAHDPADGDSPLSLFRDRPMVDGQVTLYRCTGQVCAAPIVGEKEILKTR